MNKIFNDMHFFKLFSIIKTTQINIYIKLNALVIKVQVTKSLKIIFNFKMVRQAKYFK